MTSSRSTTHPPFLDALADRLQATPEAAKATLHDVTADIRERLDRDGVYHWTGVGVFRQEGGTLSFEPSEALAASVNHRYADLTPLALPTEPSDEKPDAPAAQPPASPAPSPSDASLLAPPPEVAEQPAQGAAPSPSMPARTSRSAARRRSALREPDRRPAWPWAVGILAVVLLGSALLFFGLFDGSIDQLRTAMSAPPPATDEVAADEPPTPQREAAVPPTRTDEAAAEPAQAAEAADDPVPPAPAAIDPARGGWTIVVGAFPVETEAEAVRASFASLLGDTDLPLGILAAPPGQTRFRFRVGVGQFPTQRQAERALRDRYAVLPDDAWIMRIDS